MKGWLKVLNELNTPLESNPFFCNERIVVNYDVDEDDVPEVPNDESDDDYEEDVFGEIPSVRKRRSGRHPQHNLIVLASRDNTGDRGICSSAPSDVEAMALVEELVEKYKGFGGQFTILLNGQTCCRTPHNQDEECPTKATKSPMSEELRLFLSFSNICEAFDLASDS